MNYAGNKIISKSYLRTTYTGVWWFNNINIRQEIWKTHQKNPKWILKSVSPQFKKKWNVYSVSYTSDTESTIRFNTIKKNRNGMRIPFHTPLTRIPQSVSAHFKQKKHKRNVYSISYTSDTDYTTRFSKIQKKKKKRNSELRLTLLIVNCGSVSLQLMKDPATVCRRTIVSYD